MNSALALSSTKRGIATGQQLRNSPVQPLAIVAIIDGVRTVPNGQDFGTDGVKLIGTHFVVFEPQCASMMVGFVITKLPARTLARRGSK